MFFHKELLDCNLAAKRYLLRKICYAKTALAKDIQRDPDLARLHLEACYPGYEVLEMNVKTSEWVTGAYVRAVMCRRE